MKEVLCNVTDNSNDNNNNKDNINSTGFADTNKRFLIMLLFIYSNKRDIV